MISRTPSERSVLIKKLASDIGFTKAGITSALPFAQDADRFEAWVASGSNGLMSWLERNHDKRRDPALILPGAKSILSLALNYYHPNKIPNDSTTKISRYAWGTDYHEIIPPMLRTLLSEIQLLVPGTAGRFYTDTGPLLEKAIAERAGLGWRGKHTNLITREFGSWVFLAEIILDIELEPDLSATDMCGTCTRCIDACPTDAIVAEYQVDARRCISYLTIELKADNPIPTEFQNDLNGWMYGCDICQDVCPWNRFAEQSDLEPFEPRLENVNLSVSEIESMEQPDFSRRFRASAVKRTKLAGLKRNAQAAKHSDDRNANEHSKSV